MILTPDQLACLTEGCERIVEDNGAIRFDRLPDALAAYYRQAAGSRVRLESTSGVRLRFKTNASQLRLAWRYGEASRPFYQGVLVSGDETVVCGPAEAADAWEGTVPVKGDGLCEIWLPHLVRTDLVELELVDGELLEQPAERCRWLVYGDSITQGMTTPLPTDMWVGRCARALDLDVRSFGIGGARMESFLLETAVDWPFDVMSIHYGTNDFNGGRLADDYAENLRRLVELYLQSHPQARFLIVTPPPWVSARDPKNTAGLTIQDYRDKAVEVCTGLPRTQVLHGTDLMADDPELFVDGVHPNTAGMAAYAEQLTPILKDCLSP